MASTVQVLAIFTSIEMEPIPEPTECDLSLDLAVIYATFRDNIESNWNVIRALVRRCHAAELAMAVQASE